MRQLTTVLLLFITVVTHSKAQTPEEELHHRLDSINSQNGLAGFGISVFSTDSAHYQKRSHKQ